MPTLEQQMQSFKNKLAAKLRELPPIIGEEAVNYALESFDRQAWQGQITQPWKKHKPARWGKPEPTHPLLQHTMKGRNSIRVGKIEQHKVWLYAGGAAAPYMEVHNFGFRGVVKQNVKAYTYTRKDGTPVSVKPFTRSIRQNIPKRQFIGHSPYLNRRIARVCRAEIRALIKTLK